MSSGYVVCWIFLQKFQTYFCIKANSVDADQTAPKWLQKWLLKSQADDRLAVQGLTLSTLGNITTYWNIFPGKPVLTCHEETIGIQC